MKEIVVEVSILVEVKMIIYLEEIKIIRDVIRGIVLMMIYLLMMVN